MKLHLATTAIMLSATSDTINAERDIHAASIDGPIYKQNTKRLSAHHRSLYDSSGGSSDGFRTGENHPATTSFQTQQATRPSSPTDQSAFDHFEDPAGQGQSGFIGLGSPPGGLPSAGGGVPFDGRTEGDSFEVGGDSGSQFDGFGPGPAGGFGGPISNDGFVGTGPPPEEFLSHEEAFGSPGTHGAGYGGGYGSDGPLFFEDDSEFVGAGPQAGTGPPPEGFVSHEDTFDGPLGNFFPDGGPNGGGYGAGYGSGGPQFFEDDSEFANGPQDFLLNGGSEGAEFGLCLIHI